jgi:Tfp pilus assembly protein PilX
MIKPNEEKGFVLMTALLIMVILTLVGIGAMLNSEVEINISSNERLKKDALFAADAGTETVPVVIRYYIKNSPENFDALSEGLEDIVRTDNDGFLNEIMGYSSNNDGVSDTTTSNPDVQMTVAGRQVDVDIDRLYKKYIPGNELPEFGGPPATPSIGVYYRADALGQASQGTDKTVEAISRHLF